MKIAKHWSIQCLVTDLHVWAFALVFEMDGAHYPSYCVDANSLWIEEPCEQQQVHEIASILQKNEVWNKIFNDFLPAYKCHMQFKELACVSKWNRVKNQHGVLFSLHISHHQCASWTITHIVLTAQYYMIRYCSTVNTNLDAGLHQRILAFIFIMYKASSLASNNTEMPNALNSWFQVASYCVVICHELFLILCYFNN